VSTSRDRPRDGRQDRRAARVQVTDHGVEVVWSVGVQPPQPHRLLVAADVLEVPHAPAGRRHVGVGEHDIGVVELDEERLATGRDRIAKT
jgi:hypothetical protein